MLKYNTLLATVGMKSPSYLGNAGLNSSGLCLCQLLIARNRRMAAKDGALQRYSVCCESPWACAGAYDKEDKTKFIGRILYNLPIVFPLSF